MRTHSRQEHGEQRGPPGGEEGHPPCLRHKPTARGEPKTGEPAEPPTLQGDVWTRTEPALEATTQAHEEGRTLSQHPWVGHLVRRPLKCKQAAARAPSSLPRRQVERCNASSPNPPQQQRAQQLPPPPYKRNGQVPLSPTNQSGRTVASFPLLMAHARRLSSSPQQRQAPRNPLGTAGNAPLHTPSSNIFGTLCGKWTSCCGCWAQL